MTEKLPAGQAKRPIGNACTLQVALGLCTVLLALVCLASGQSKSATLPAEQQARNWLAAFNSGDKEKFKAFLQQNRPADVEHVDDLLGFRAMTGGFELEKTEESSSLSFTALVKERDSDQFARLVMEVEKDEPHRISKFELNAVSRPAEFAIPREAEAAAIGDLRKHLDEETAKGRFAGAALISKNGKVVFEQAYGLADREKKMPNQVNTKFRIGSMNKMFTAVCILQLAQAGELDLNAPFGKYLAGYANQEMSSSVTIDQLLTHRGGTGDIFGPQFDAHRLELRSLQDYIQLYEKRDLEFKPGTRWQYSNYGFLLLGAVIEKVSGQSYYDYVRKHVFQPAGMTSTDSLPESEPVEDRSVGYTKTSAGGWRPNGETLPYRGTSAGGGYSTVEDLNRFATALKEHKLLDPLHTELLTTGKVDTPNGSKYAYGFSDSSESGMSCFGHGGGAPGMNGDLKICPRSGYVIAVLSNLDPPAAQRGSNYATARLPMK
jgi:CubicO group peptidase (beta-lactamase class C family)